MNKQAYFYHGDLDDQIVTVANGARVNKDFAEFVEQGPWKEVKTHQLGSRIHCITGYGLPNYTFIETDTGFILVDTGMNFGSGFELLKFKQEISDKPVVAIIYTHHHYTGGTQAIVQQFPERDIPVYGHPDVDKNLATFFSYMAPAAMRRANIQVGRVLPETGQDASYGIEEPSFAEPALNGSGHKPVTHPVADGETVNIDGLDVVFYHAVADTEDSLIIHIPELDAVIHNTAVMPFMFPVYTLRGDYYRDLPEVLASIDKLREINPEYLIGCHGFPVSGRETAYEFATAHRDALAFIYQQTVKGINCGHTPSRIAQDVRLPPQLTKIPELFPAYVDVEHMVRGIYRGLIGWWAEDTAELHPPSERELAEQIVQGFGGEEQLLECAKQRLSEKRYNLAAKLANYVLDCDSENQAAQHLKADALRSMAYATPTGIQTRNFLLHEALQLEGAVPRNEPNVSSKLDLPAAMIAALPAETIPQTLCYRVDAVRSEDLVATVKIAVTDVSEEYFLVIRHGSVEQLKQAPKACDVEFAFDRDAWAEMFLKKLTMNELIEQGRLQVSGDSGLARRVIDAYCDMN